jgi:Tfp pilus assembly protein PilV
MTAIATRSAPPRSRQRGVTLLESLVAFFVLAAGSVAVAQMQSHSRLAADIARERSEAVRLGEQAIEELRAFASIEGPPGAHTYAAIATASTVVAAASGVARNAYRIDRVVDAAAFTGAKAMRVAVRWADRSGAPREVVVDSFIAAVDPAYSGSLALDAGAIPATPRGARGRKPGLPLTGKSLGDGRSAWKPRESGATAWVFDDRSGAIVAVCEGVPTTTLTRDLAADALRSCTSGGWLFVAGTLRSAATAPPVAMTATTVRIDLRDGLYPAPAACFAEARKTVRFVDDGGLHVDDVALEASAASSGLSSWEETGDRFLAWHCAVATRADGRWSGRIAIVASGWSIGTGAADGRICRFAAGDDRASIDANIASAGVDVDVGAALPGRNFLVVRGSDPCPRTPPTEQHQP